MKKAMLILFAAMMLSGSAHSLCLTGCSEEKAAGHVSAGGTLAAYPTGQFRYRDGSHDTRDVKNSVMGDVNIHVGHKRMDVKIDQGSGNNSVNASVSSTIILGDVKQ